LNQSDLDSYVGVEWNAQLESALHRDHLREINHYKAKDTLNRLRMNVPLSKLTGSMSESMVCAVLRSRDDPTIVGLRENCVGDLFTFNFAQWLAMQFQPVGQSTSGYQMRDINNVLQTSGQAYGAQIYSSGYYYISGWWNDGMNASFGSGFSFQFGSGATAATRSDYKIQTPLAVAPENAKFDTGFGSYGGGGVAVSGCVAASGTGNIQEVGLIGNFAIWVGPYYFLMTHDIFASPIGYIPGNILLASLLIQT
jgi:hypothetical protein